MINLNTHQDADIPNQSVIHAVRGGRWSARSAKGLATPLSKIHLATVEEESEAEGATNAAGAGMKNSESCLNFLYLLVCINFFEVSMKIT